MSLIPDRAPDLKLDDIVKISFESYGMDMSETLAVEVRVDYPYISQSVLERHKIKNDQVKRSRQGLKKV